MESNIGSAEIPHSAPEELISLALEDGQELPSEPAVTMQAARVEEDTSEEAKKKGTFTRLRKKTQKRRSSNG